MFAGATPLCRASKGSVGDALEVEGFAGWLFDEPVLGVSMFYDGGSDRYLR